MASTAFHGYILNHHIVLSMTFDITQQLRVESAQADLSQLLPEQVEYQV
jgi:hypothetical protein